MILRLTAAMFFLASASISHAHPGHGTADGPLHYVVEPEHIGLTLLALAVIGLAGWAWGRARRSG